MNTNGKLQTTKFPADLRIEREQNSIRSSQKKKRKGGGMNWKMKFLNDRNTTTLDEIKYRMNKTLDETNSGNIGDLNQTFKMWFNSSEIDREILEKIIRTEYLFQNHNCCRDIVKLASSMIGNNDSSSSSLYSNPCYIISMGHGISFKIEKQS